MLAIVLCVAAATHVVGDSGAETNVQEYALTCDGLDPFSMQMKSRGMCLGPWTLPDPIIIEGIHLPCATQSCDVSEWCDVLHEYCFTVNADRFIEQLLELECDANDESERDTDGDGGSDCLEAEAGTRYDEEDTDGDGIMDSYDLSEENAPLQFLLNQFAIADLYESGDPETSCDQSTAVTDRNFDPYLSGVAVSVLPATTFYIANEALDGFSQSNHPHNTVEIQGTMGAGGIPGPAGVAYLDMSSLTGELTSDISRWFSTSIDFLNPPTTGVELAGLMDGDSGEWYWDPGEDGKDDPVATVPLGGVSIIGGWGEPLIESRPVSNDGCGAKIRLGVDPVVTAEEWVSTATAGEAHQQGRVATLAEYHDNLAAFID